MTVAYQVYPFRVPAGNPIVFLGRIQTPAGSVDNVQSTFTEVRATVQQEDPPPVEGDPPVITLDDQVLTGTLSDIQIDSRWTSKGRQNEGFNFEWECPGSAFPLPNLVYFVEIRFFIGAVLSGMLHYRGSTNSIAAVSSP